jgi:hypothetical protein
MEYLEWISCQSGELLAGLFFAGIITIGVTLNGLAEIIKAIRK